VKVRRSKSRESGFTLLEVVVSSVVLAVALMTATAAFSSNLIAAEEAKRLTAGGIFLETVTEDVLAQDFDNLLALNGNTIFDGGNLAGSEYSVDLIVFLAGIDLIQIQAVLNDLQSGHEIGRIGTLRRRQ